MGCAEASQRFHAGLKEKKINKEETADKPKKAKKIETDDKAEKPKRPRKVKKEDTEEKADK